MILIRLFSIILVFLYFYFIIKIWSQEKAKSSGRINILKRLAALRATNLSMGEDVELLCLVHSLGGDFDNADNLIVDNNDYEAENFDKALAYLARVEPKRIVLPKKLPENCDQVLHSLSQIYLNDQIKLSDELNECIRKNITSLGGYFLYLDKPTLMISSSHKVDPEDLAKARCLVALLHSPEVMKKYNYQLEV